MDAGGMNRRTDAEVLITCKWDAKATAVRGVVSGGIRPTWILIEANLSSVSTLSMK